jgi:hypothetical protein
MTDAARLDLSVIRTEDLIPREVRLTDIENNPIDVTDWDFDIVINTANGLGGSPLLHLTDTPNGNGSYCKVLEGANGSVEFFVAKEDVGGLAGPVDEDTVFVWNLRATDQSGYFRIVARGEFILEPGV